MRGERSTKSKSIPNAKKKSSSKTNTSTGLIQAATVATATTTQAFKRQGTALDNAKKLAKKKKRVSAPIVAEEQNTTAKPQTDQAPAKAKKSSKPKSAKHKEIIDYSSRTGDSHSHSNTFGKVHKWLLESPVAPTQPSAEVEHTSKVRQIMTKSQSTPERLAPRAPKKVKSANNLNDKVKLQVVYKPPFKFSLKLSKNSAVKTKVLSTGVAGVAGVAGTRSKRKNRTEKTDRGTRDGAVVKPRRTALLIRSAATADEHDGPMISGLKTNCSEDQQQLVTSEPNYETLTPKVDTPTYENVSLSTGGGANKSDAINTATFRINKSASGSNILGKSISMFIHSIVKLYLALVSS